MFRSVRARHLTIWLALVAMLAFALLPTMSRAMGGVYGNGSWAEVCTSAGMKLVPADDGSGAAGLPASGGMLDHCPMCSLATDGAAPLPVAASPLALPLRSAEPPRLFLQAAVTQQVWLSTQPRGPPVLR